MARTGLKKVKNVSGSTASNAKKTQSSSGAAQRATGKRHTGPQQQPKQIATHQHQQQKRQTRQNPSTSSPMLRSKGRAEGARDDIDKAFNNLRGSNDDGSALKVKQERPRPPKLGGGLDSTSAAASRWSQDQLLQTFESLMS